MSDDVKAMVEQRPDLGERAIAQQIVLARGTRGCRTWIDVEKRIDAVRKQVAALRTNSSRESR